MVLPLFLIRGLPLWGWDQLPQPGELDPSWAVGWHRYYYMHGGVCLPVSVCPVQQFYLPLQTDFFTLPVGTTPALNSNNNQQLYCTSYVLGTVLSALPVIIIYLHQTL